MKESDQANDAKRICDKRKGKSEPHISAFNAEFPDMQDCIDHVIYRENLMKVFEQYCKKELKIPGFIDMHNTEAYTHCLDEREK